MISSSLRGPGNEKLMCLAIGAAATVAGLPVAAADRNAAAEAPGVPARSTPTLAATRGNASLVPDKEQSHAHLRQQETAGVLERLKKLVTTYSRDEHHTETFALVWDLSVHTSTLR